MKQTTKLILKTESEEIIIKFKTSDVSLEQYFDAFKGLLVQQSWTEKQINKFIVELADEISTV